jgi:choline dehydrogenase-like flavoprotein
MTRNRRSSRKLDCFQACQQPKATIGPPGEAGGKNDDPNLRVDGQRWTTHFNKDMNWGFKTVPQADCANHEVDYSRGRGLGGSSAINFSVWSIGARDDYEEWARIVGDEDSRWKEIQRRAQESGDLPR